MGEQVAAGMIKNKRHQECLRREETCCGQTAEQPATDIARQPATGIVRQGNESESHHIHSTGKPVEPSEH